MGVGQSCFPQQQKRVHNDSPKSSPTSLEYQHSWNFITREGSRLIEDGTHFRFASFNVPGLLMTEDRSPDPTWLPPTPEEQEDAILTVKLAYGRVIRTYTLGFGPGHHMSAPGVFYEPAWVAMDHALAIARCHQVRLVIPIVNNHFKGDEGGPENFGDYWTLCNFRGLLSSSFFTDRTLREDLKGLITFLLNRVNTVNGIRYGDDPTVLAWQLGNELGGWVGPPPPAEWTLEIAKHIKSLAPRTLIMDGTMGGLSSKYMYQTECLESPLIDIFDNHYYNGRDTDLKCIKRDVELVVKGYKKAFILGEFGFDFKNCDAMYSAALRNNLISGALIWSLRYHSRDGGFYFHREVEPEKGFWSFHAPGFPMKEGFSVDDLRMCHTVRKYGLQMMGMKDPGLPIPPPVRSAAKPVSSPLEITWFGSAWAASYCIERRDDDSGETICLSSNVSDGVATAGPGNILFIDETASAGKKYCYLIKPVGSNGQINHRNPLTIHL